MDFPKIEIETFGGSPIAEHNYPCPIYLDRHAVYIMNKGYFQPSWDAQKDGYRIIKADTKFKKLILRLVFNE